MAFYFDAFEERRPSEPLPYSATWELLYQFLATVTLVIGGWYIGWRWAYSLNYDALWFAVPLLLAETFAYIGLMLFTFNLWKTQDYEQRDPPELHSETVDEKLALERPILIDMFFPTYDEDPELVRLSIHDAKQVTYPHSISVNIHVLDDGKRDAVRVMAEEEQVNYITRESNIGFKAGNIRNAMEQTGGDFIVISDADTRVFPTILENTLGYFRDPDVAWVQTPQWFYDIPEGKPLPIFLKKYTGVLGYWIGRFIVRIIGPVTIGKDPFVNDPQMFYDVIQRRRNWVNASFCCGAGSVHRREAVMEVALRSFSDNIGVEVANIMKQVAAQEGGSSATYMDQDGLTEIVRRETAHQVMRETELTPYKFHVSEDIYTSIALHSDQERNWKSVLHPQVESKMLSPQDLQSWMVQRFKYAGGAIDISVNDDPVFRKGLGLKQKIMYAATFWSNFGGVWNIVFLLAPIIYLFTGIAPVNAYSMNFFKHILPFLMLNELSTMVGTWGVAGFKGKASYLAFFPIHLKAIWTVLRGKQIKFPITPKERQEGNYFHLVIPQFLVVLLTIIAITYASYGYYHGEFESLEGLVTNLFWGFNNIAAMSGLLLAAFWKPSP